MSLKPALRSLLLALTGVVVCLIGLQAQSAVAAPTASITFFVSGYTDPTPTPCALAIGGYSCPSLRAAIIAANNNPGWDTIVLAHNVTYTLTIPAVGTNDASTGDLNITNHLNFTFGAGLCLSSCNAIIQGGPGWTDRLFDIPANIRVDIKLLTLRNGSIDGLGGAIRNSGILTLTDCLVTHNTSGGAGGIYNWYDGTLNLINTRLYSNTSVAGNYTGYSGGLSNEGVAYLTNTTIDQNYAGGPSGGVSNWGRLFMVGGVISGNIANNVGSSANGGGGLVTFLGGGGVGPGNSLNLTGTQIVNNRTHNGNGGGLVIDDGVWATLSGVTVTGNSNADYDYGGGIYINGNLTLEHSTVQGNTGGEGGGIYLDVGQVTISRTLIAGNHSREYGGGLYVAANTHAYLAESQFTANTADYGGGGIYNLGWLSFQSITLNANQSQDGGGLYNAGTSWMINSTLSGNRATRNGGGLYNVNPGFTAYLGNVTLAGNLADADANGVGDGGGVVAALGTLSVTNTLIGQNISWGGSQADCSGTLNSLGYNLLQNTTGCALTGTLTGNITGQAPRLGPLQDNGGSTWTHALLIGSPAINAGNPAGTLFDVCLSTDQRGVARVGRCDIGAYEAGRWVFLPAVRH